MAPQATSWRTDPKFRAPFGVPPPAGKMESGLPYKARCPTRVSSIHDADDDDVPDERLISDSVSCRKVTPPGTAEEMLPIFLPDFFRILLMKNILKKYFGQNYFLEVFIPIKILRN